MRDRLPEKPNIYESAIVNLDTSLGEGTHWVCYKKIKNKVYYFDSFGNLKPPLELQRYFGDCDIYYNYSRKQSYNSVICGHLCLQFLSNAES
jgi:hypothetical protein